MARVSILPGAFLSSVHELFKNRGYDIVDLHSKPDTIVWTGGPDINPALYNAKPHQSTYFIENCDKRDLAALDLANNLYPNIPKIGICRGAQLLNAAAGGGMWQNTDRHTIDHDMTDLATGQKVHTSSCHHQMMRPSPDATILTIAKQSTFVEDAEDMKVRKLEDYDDIEVLFYPHINALCYQGHPEIDQKPGVDYFFSLVDKHLGV